MLAAVRANAGASEPDRLNAIIAAAEDAADIRDAATARLDPERVPHDELMRELGLESGGERSCD